MLRQLEKLETSQLYDGSDHVALTQRLEVSNLSDIYFEGDVIFNNSKRTWEKGGVEVFLRRSLDRLYSN